MTINEQLYIHTGYRLTRLIALYSYCNKMVYFYTLQFVLDLKADITSLLYTAVNFTQIKREQP